MKMLSVFFGSPFSRQKWRGISPPVDGPRIIHSIHAILRLQVYYTVCFATCQAELARLRNPPPAELASVACPHRRNCGAALLDNTETYSRGVSPYARRDCIHIIRIFNKYGQSHRLNEAIKCSLWGPRLDATLAFPPLHTFPVSCHHHRLPAGGLAPGVSRRSRR